MAGETPIGWGTVDDAESTRALFRAVDRGITFFDTADFYGLGHSEELLGAVLGNRPDVVIATKVGHRLGENREVVLDYTASHIRRACEGSLRRLRRDCIDYYQLHSAKLEHLEAGECVEAMESLQQQGKIRFWGISLNTFQPDREGDYMLSRNLGQGFQCVVNLINQRAVRFVRQANEAGYGVVARMPLQFGLLTGKFSRTTRFAGDDHRHFRLPPEILEASLDALEELRPLLNDLGTSLTSLSLSYCASVPGVSTVIPGIRTARQADQNTQVTRSLSGEQLGRLEELYQRRFADLVSLMERQG
jgi:aryl-alcohol dehydrogenase-like predicted oxidoreductase